MKALLIIDVQNDYFPGGRNPLHEPDKALEKIGTALRQFRAAGRPVIHVQHINTRPGATFFLPGTQGAEIHSALTPLAGEPVVVKQFPNSFHQTGLPTMLQERSVDELVVCGMMTHMCIDTTVRAAKDHGIPVTLLHDACATKDLSIHGRTIPAQIVHEAYMAGLSGMFAQVIAADQLQL